MTAQSTALKVSGRRQLLGVLRQIMPRLRLICPNFVFDFSQSFDFIAQWPKNFVCVKFLSFCVK